MLKCILKQLMEGIGAEHLRNNIDWGTGIGYPNPVIPFLFYANPDPVAEINPVIPYFFQAFYLRDRT